MKAVQILVVLLLLFISVASALDKAPTREITEFTVGVEPEIFASIELVPGGGALLSGFTSTTELRQMDGYLAEVAANTTLLWEIMPGDTLSEELYHALPIYGGGYIAVGTTNSYGDKAFDLWVLRLDADHNEIWSLSLGPDPFGVATQVRPDGAGGWFVSGFQSDGVVERADFRVVRMDDDGTIIWDNIYGGPEHDFALTSCTTMDGGLIVAGSTHSFTSENRDGYVMKIDADGNQVWQRVIGGPWPDYFNDIKRTSDGNYVLVGTTHVQEIEEESDMYIVLINEDSDTLFETNVGGDSWDEGMAVVQTTDRGYFCVGNSFDPDAGVMNGFGVRLDEFGNVLWTDPEYGDEDGYQELHDVIIWDGDLVRAVGYTSSTDMGDADFLVMQIDASATVLDPASPTLSRYVSLGPARPNPFNATTVFNVYLPTAMNLEVTVYNVLGQKVRNLTRARWAAGNHTFDWRADNHASGTYIIEARTDTQTLRQRILLVK
jgi:hypothetical protein